MSQSDNNNSFSGVRCTQMTNIYHTSINVKPDWHAVYIESVILYLHSTFTVAALEVSFPRLLLATHRYSPLYVLFTFVIVNCFLSGDKLILWLLIGDPFFVHDNVGAGFPAALQDKVTVSPSVLETFRG